MLACNCRMLASSRIHTSAHLSSNLASSRAGTSASSSMGARWLPVSQELIPSKAVKRDSTTFQGALMPRLRSKLLSPTRRSKACCPRPCRSCRMVLRASPISRSRRSTPASTRALIEDSIWQARNAGTALVACRTFLHGRGGGMAKGCSSGSMASTTSIVRHAASCCVTPLIDRDSENCSSLAVTSEERLWGSPPADATISSGETSASASLTVALASMRLQDSQSENTVTPVDSAPP
mmetsp:Transcript_13454/g.25054  ORF Transcript_13454/g.25054 Transcript_13454/m.25054 type:complete len:237 (+) Transcript_13454:94-804(+)